MITSYQFSTLKSILREMLEKDFSMRPECEIIGDGSSMENHFSWYFSEDHWSWKFLGIFVMIY